MDGQRLEKLEKFGGEKGVAIHNVEALNELLELLDTPAPSGSLGERYGTVEIGKVKRLLTMALRDPEEQGRVEVRKEDARHTAKDVALWFLDCNRCVEVMNGGGDMFMSLSKLQRLLYYAQGMSLALYNKPLFKDDICAWTYGPVVESVFKRYKKFYDNNIVEKKHSREKYTKDEEALLDDTFNAFGKYTALWLSRLSREDTPFCNTVQGEVMDLELIRECFVKTYLDKDGMPISGFEFTEDEAEEQEQEQEKE